MKYQFNKIFPLSIKEEKSAGKPHLGFDLGANLGHNFFLTKLEKMAKNLISGPILVRLVQNWASKILFEGFTSTRC